MDHLLDALNPVQREAVTAPAGPLLILAGAGSGKTRVLTHRIAWLLADQGVDPGRIAGITFTNKAADEMRSRLDGLAGEGGRRLWLHTFHALGARLLREFGPLVDVPREFVILDDADSASVVRAGLRESGRTGDAAPAAVQSAISRAKDAGLDAAAYAARAEGVFEELVAGVYRAYEAALRRSGGVDFDDLIRLPIRLLEERPEAAALLHDRLHWVLVDEYQDTSASQYRLLRGLAGPRGNVTCVGDPDQSIYSWRGADLRNILEFERDFPTARVVTMEQNYRSTGRVLAAASELIAHNRRRRPKRLWTDGPLGRPLAAYQATDEVDEARFIGEGIAGWIAAGARAGQFAVLYRTHAQSRALEEAMAGRGLPYAVFGGVKFYARREVKDALSWLRLLAHPGDALALDRALQSPPRGVGEATFARLLEAADASGRRVLEVLGSDEFLAAIPGRARKGVREFLAGLNRMSEVRAEQGYASALAAGLEVSGYAGWLETRSAEFADRAENLAELLAAAREAEEAGLPLEGFLERAALLADADRRRDDAEVVTLMTLHNAKGLEFPHVFVAGLEEGLLPHQSSLTDEAELEEERRLFYVGLTRARESVVLTAARGRRIREKFQWGSASRFLGEIPRELIVPVERPADLPLAEDARRREPAAPPPPVGADPGWHGGAGDGTEGEEPDLAPGDDVRHEHFGTGRVLSVTGHGRAMRVVVSFPRHGRRTFLAGMARLERVRELA